VKTSWGPHVPNEENKNPGTKLSDALYIKATEQKPFESGGKNPCWILGYHRRVA
jgi:hypothetical protein